MLSSTKRRISVLECSIPIPITADVLLTRAQERARLTGATFEEAFQSLIPSLSTLDLERLADEFLQLTCGDDMEARNEVMQRAMMTDAGSDEDDEQAASGA
jgi:hypothetical protein